MSSIEHELSLDEKKGRAQSLFLEQQKRFGFEKSEAFRSRLEQMMGMDHGPNHTEGDPAIHTALVVFELDTALAPLHEGFGDDAPYVYQGVTFTRGDIEMLRITALIHDIAKADTQKYDVANAEQAVLAEVSSADVDAAKQVRAEALSRVSGKTADEIIVLSGGQFNKLVTELSLEQKAVYEQTMRDMGNTREYPGLIVNFREHDDVGAQLVPQLLTESGQSDVLSESLQDDVRFLVQYHMKLLRPKDVSLNLAKEMFVRDGVWDDRRMALLILHTFADDAASYRKGKTADTRRSFQSEVQVLLERYKQQWVQKQEELRAQAAEAQRIVNALGMPLSEFVSSCGIPAGKDFGRALSTAKMAIERLFDQGITPSEVQEQVRRAIVGS